MVGAAVLKPIGFLLALPGGVSLGDLILPCIGIEATPVTLRLLLGALLNYAFPYKTLLPLSRPFSFLHCGLRKNQTEVDTICDRGFHLKLRAGFVSFDLDSGNTGPLSEVRMAKTIGRSIRSPVAGLQEDQQEFPSATELSLFRNRCHCPENAFMGSWGEKFGQQRKRRRGFRRAAGREWAEHRRAKKGTARTPVAVTYRSMRRRPDCLYQIIFFKELKLYFAGCLGPDGLSAEPAEPQALHSGTEIYKSTGMGYGLATQNEEEYSLRLSPLAGPYTALGEVPTFVTITPVFVCLVDFSSFFLPLLAAFSSWVDNFF
ncbi:hypothetical protein HPP92_003570 [Vanilla planifolia]|uniref:Uncharacterized protein n=1 Tax=Vanilla planifolia TaxID=51239 RepID=A0A835S9C5_VANPL|nr:hypothetical protein HPP92_003953 [Vanilla planifolia]KAG0503498.1 hypothetical protein HPP92_003570 [Vanilla planifolia]